MKIKYIKAKNFLSIGEQPIEIDFTKYGNIINIKGCNLDAGNGASNGSGKSTLIEILVYGFYGKLIKGLSHKEAINIKSKRGLEVEVHWDDYKILRRRAPDRLQLWKGDDEITLGGIPATDELIRSIIKLNYNSFINVSCFGQHNNYAFLSCDTSEKRQIAENLLSLDKYLAFSKVAKEKMKALKDKVSHLSSSYQISTQELSNAQKKLIVIESQRQQWKESKLNSISAIEIKIKECGKKLEEIRSRKDVQDYESYQTILSDLESEIEKRDKTRSDIHAVLEKADLALQQRKDERQNLAIEVSSLERDFIIISSEIKHLELCCTAKCSKEGTICENCYEEISESNIEKMIERDVEKIKTLQVKLTESENKKKISQEKLSICEASINKISDGRKLIRDKDVQNLNSLTELLDRKKQLTKTFKPDVTSEIALFDKDLQYLQEKLENARQEFNEDPYGSMIEMANVDIGELEARVNFYKKGTKDIETQIPYYNFWVKAFGDDGIRAFVIDEIIPALNSRINYWLQFLMDGRVQVHFDNQLEETIQRVPIDQDPFVYNGMSGGEHCRIDLAISQAFAHVMMLTANSCPSLVCLDEVGANIDRPGIQSIYKMICELGRDRQVIVITHDPDLLDLMAGYDTIEVVMENGISTIKSKEGYIFSQKERRYDF